MLTAVGTHDRVTADEAFGFGAVDREVGVKLLAELDGDVEVHLFVVEVVGPGGKGCRQDAAASDLFCATASSSRRVGVAATP